MSQLRARMISSMEEYIATIQLSVQQASRRSTRGELIEHTIPQVLKLDAADAKLTPAGRAAVTAAIALAAPRSTLFRCGAT
jgi:hypothetical protein